MTESPTDYRTIFYMKQRLKPMNRFFKASAISGFFIAVALIACAGEPKNQINGLWFESDTMTRTCTTSEPWTKEMMDGNLLVEMDKYIPPTKKQGCYAEQVVAWIDEHEKVHGVESLSKEDAQQAVSALLDRVAVLEFDTTPTFNTRHSLFEEVYIGPPPVAADFFSDGTQIPPAKYDHPPAKAPLVIRRPFLEVDAACGGRANPSGGPRITGCTIRHSKDWGGACVVILPDAKDVGPLYLARVTRHEFAHCNGWNHELVSTGKIFTRSAAGTR